MQEEGKEMIFVIKSGQYISNITTFLKRHLLTILQNTVIFLSYHFVLLSVWYSTLSKVIVIVALSVGIFPNENVNFLYEQNLHLSCSLLYLQHLEHGPYNVLKKYLFLKLNR
jgi:hypothetical protein